MHGINVDRVQIRKVIVEVRYWTATQFPDRRAELVAASESESIRLNQDENNINIEDRENACTKAVGIFRCGINTEAISPRNAPGDFLLQTAWPWVSEILKILGPPRLRRIGVRQLGIYPYEGDDYPSLAQRAIANVFPIEETAWDALGARPEDMTARFRMRVDDMRAANLMLAPVRRSEVTEKLDIRDPTDLPDCGMWVDWDLYTARPDLRVRDVNEMLRDAKDLMKDQVAGFLKAL